jgi:hypothetical protein
VHCPSIPDQDACDAVLDLIADQGLGSRGSFAFQYSASSAQDGSGTDNADVRVERTGRSSLKGM